MREITESLTDKWFPSASSQRKQLPAGADIDVTKAVSWKQLPWDTGLKELQFLYTVYLDIET